MRHGDRDGGAGARRRAVMVVAELLQALGRWHEAPLVSLGSLFDRRVQAAVADVAP